MGIPNDLQEAAEIDGADEMVYFFKILLPVCTPIIATISMWQFVGMWNSYFDAMIYLNSASKQPLQLVLRSILIQSQPEPGMVSDMQSTAERAQLAELLKYAKESETAVASIDAALAKAKNTSSRAGSMWHAAVKDADAARKAVEYYRALDEQRRKTELLDQKQMLTEQLKGDAAKVLREMSDKYQKQIADIRLRRDINIEIGKRTRHIKRIVKKLNDRIIHEEDYKNVKEPLKPVVHKLVQTFIDGFDNMVFDQKTADRLRSVYDEIANEEDDKREAAELAARRYYKVRSGDTLSGIAVKYGTTVTRICQLNGINRNAVLKVGKTLRVK